MSHYEERLQRDLDRIRRRVVQAGRCAADAFENAVRALLTHDDELAYRTILGDHRLNRDIRELDALCHAFIARHLPSAGHLRFVSSVLRIDVAIERIGDYAVTIARESVQLSEPPPQEIVRDLRTMAKQAHRTLVHALDAFEQCNAELARGTITAARQVDTTFDAVFDDLVEAGEARQRPLRDLFSLLVGFNRIERVSDQAKNLCEETIFAETGETKAPKVYRVAFVDERNDCLSVMAEAIARKAYPNSGRYLSAGWAPAEALDPGFVAFMNERGHDVEEFRPGSIQERLDALQRVDVVVGLPADPRPHLPGIPFHTVVQWWDVGSPPADLDRDRADAVLADIYRELAARIEDLMVTLHGEEAD